MVQNTHQRRDEGYTERIQIGKRCIGLIVAQTSLMRLPVCAESWELRSSFPRDFWRAESLVPPE